MWEEGVRKERCVMLSEASGRQRKKEKKGLSCGGSHLSIIFLISKCRTSERPTYKSDRGDKRTRSRDMNGGSEMMREEFIIMHVGVCADKDY